MKTYYSNKGSRTKRLFGVIYEKWFLTLNYNLRVDFKKKKLVARISLNDFKLEICPSKNIIKLSYSC